MPGRIGHVSAMLILDRIHDKGYAENVVDLMLGKLARLPAENKTGVAAIRVPR